MLMRPSALLFSNNVTLNQTGKKNSLNFFLLKNNVNWLVYIEEGYMAHWLYIDWNAKQG